jgi:hypothetical protein
MTAVAETPTPSGPVATITQMDKSEIEVSPEPQGQPDFRLLFLRVLEVILGSIALGTGVLALLFRRWG